MPNIVWNPEEEVQWRTCSDDAWSDKTLPNQSQSFQICLWGSVNTNQYKQHMTSDCILIEDLHQNRKKLWHLWQRIASDYQGSDWMETLYTRNKSHDDSIFRSQKFNILPKCTKSELKTGTMVITLVGIWHQITSHARDQNDICQCLIQEIWSLSRGWSQ